MINPFKKQIFCKYSGSWTDFTGYGEANRNAIIALHKAEVELTTERISFAPSEANHGEGLELAKELEGRPIKYNIKILHIPPDGYMKYLEPTKYHIGHLFWETDSLARTWVWNCNLLDEIWTGGHFHKEAFLKAGVKVPIYIFPQAINTDISVQKPFILPEHKGFLFYSIFQWIERKNPEALLRAYWDEFQGEENVSLLLKVYRFGFDQAEKEKIRGDVLKWKRESGHKSFPRTYIFTNLMDQADVFKLHYTGDCFVSAHRGEGWGIPQVEASIIGNPIISTNLGGCHEWFNDNTSFLVKWNKVNVFNMEFAPWYDPKQIWAEVDPKDLREKMRYVFQNPQEAREFGRKGQEMVKREFNYMHVGQLMRNRLEEIDRLIKW